MHGLEVAGRQWRGVCVGTECTNLAQDRTAWRSKMNEMIKLKKQMMADRSVNFSMSRQFCIVWGTRFCAAGFS